MSVASTFMQALQSGWIENPRVGGSIPPPGTILNDFNSLTNFSREGQRVVLVTTMKQVSSKLTGQELCSASHGGS